MMGTYPHYVDFLFPNAIAPLLFPNDIILIGIFLTNGYSGYDIRNFRVIGVTSVETVTWIPTSSYISVLNIKPLKDFAINEREI